MNEVFSRLSFRACTEESGQREVVESHLRRLGWSLERTVDGPKHEMTHQPEHLPWDSHSVDISIHQGRTHFLTSGLYLRFQHIQQTLRISNYLVYWMTYPRDG